MKTSLIAIILVLLSTLVSAHPGHGVYEAFQKEMNGKQTEIDKAVADCTSETKVCRRIKENQKQFQLHLREAGEAWGKYVSTAGRAEEHEFYGIVDELNGFYAEVIRLRGKR